MNRGNVMQDLPFLILPSLFWVKHNNLQLKINSLREIRKKSKKSVVYLPLLANFVIYMLFYFFSQPGKFAMVNMAVFPTTHLLTTR